MLRWWMVCNLNPQREIHKKSWKKKPVSIHNSLGALRKVFSLFFFFKLHVLMLRKFKCAESIFFKQLVSDLQTQTKQKSPPLTMLNQLCHIGKIHCVPGWYQILSLRVIYESPETNSQRKHENHWINQIEINVEQVFSLRYLFFIYLMFILERSHYCIHTYSSNLWMWFCHESSNYP